ncbi:RNA methyltransferase [Candidatus Poribacteria bacterium]|nr:RNA methyltransferase [Candidatus Poribacteria bacterium]
MGKAARPDDSASVIRVRDTLRAAADTTERRMFGGHCFMLNGNMVCGVTGDDTLMVRVGKDAYEAALAQPNAREMDFTGRPMRGMVFVESAGYETDDGIAEWLERGLAFARTLPPK